MKFKCECGSVHYQIFGTFKREKSTYVTDDSSDFPVQPIWDQGSEDSAKFYVQCEFCNVIYGPKPSMKQLTSSLKKQGALR